VVNARSIGPRSVAPPTLVALAFSTWTNLVGLCAYVGLGLLGLRRINHGSVWKTHATMTIWSSSTRSQKVTIGDGMKASFWNDPWVDGLSPKCIAPSIFALSSKKSLNVRDSIIDGAWVDHLDTSEGLSVQNLIEFTKLWSHTSLFHLHADTPDSIVWKLTSNGAYSCSSAYKAQFEGTICSCMDAIVWKASTPPKCKLFAWLIIQNRVWTADRLAKRGWPNGRVCPLCRCHDEYANHLLFKCRFSIRIWKMIQEWLHIHFFR
jgi:hypothetical protein